MLEQQIFSLRPAEIRTMIADHPWAQLISPPAAPGAELVVSHLPVLADPDTEEPVVLGHLATEDAEVHQLGRHKIVVVVPGPNGYISPSWYADGPFVPTWNFAVAHLHGTPEILDADRTYRVLEATCERMENERPQPWRLSQVQEYADMMAKYVTAFRLVPDRAFGKWKMNQDKPPEIVERVITALETDTAHGNPALAEQMRRARARG